MESNPRGLPKKEKGKLSEMQKSDCILPTRDGHADLGSRSISNVFPSVTRASRPAIHQDAASPVLHGILCTGGAGNNALEELEFWVDVFFPLQILSPCSDGVHSVAKNSLAGLRESNFL